MWPKELHEFVKLQGSLRCSEKPSTTDAVTGHLNPINTLIPEFISSIPILSSLLCLGDITQI
jgi:hypothetical protein